MPRFQYTAKSGPHKTIQGDIEADSEQEAVRKLTESGCFPVSIKANTIALEKINSWHFWKIPRKNIVIFTRQLSNLISSGIDILKGLNIISGQTANKYLRAILEEVISKIKDGKSLSESLSCYPYIFSELYTSIIHSGELSGNMEQALERLADFLEKEEEFKNSISAALIYPAFVLIVGVLTVAILILFVIPRLISIFNDMGQILPLPTRILIALSGFFSAYGWVVLAAAVTAVYLLRKQYRKPKNRIYIDGIKLRLPVLGGIILKQEIGRLTRTLSLLLSSGMPIVYSLQTSVSVIENQVLKSEMLKFKEQVSNGSSLSVSLKGSKLFADYVTNIVAIGEETGTLEKSLARISADYEKDVDRLLKALTRILEPVIILIMGLIVGFIVMSMLLPIFQMNLIVR